MMASSENDPAIEPPSFDGESARGSTITSEPRDRIIIVLVLVAVCTVCDFLIWPVIVLIDPDETTVVFALFVTGLMGAQGGMLAIWSVLGPGRAWMRHAIELALGTLWLSASAAGFLAATANASNLAANWLNVAWPALWVPAIYLAAQTPLWLMRVVFRWRIELDSPEHRRTDPPLTLANLMLFTAMVAASLAAARCGISIAELESSDLPWMWLWLGVQMLVAAVLSLASALPAVGLIMGKLPIQSGMALFVGYGVLAWVVVGVGLVLLQGAPAPAEILFIIPLYLIPLFAGFVGGFACPLFLARVMGYRLAWGRPQASDTEKPGL